MFFLIVQLFQALCSKHTSYFSSDLLFIYVIMLSHYCGPDSSALPCEGSDNPHPAVNMLVRLH